MAPQNNAERMQSAREATSLAAALVRNIDALRNLYRLREIGLFSPDDLSAEQLNQLGLNDPAEIGKLLDTVPDLENAHTRALIARGLAG